MFAKIFIILLAVSASASVNAARGGLTPEALYEYKSVIDSYITRSPEGTRAEPFRGSLARLSELLNKPEGNCQASSLEPLVEQFLDVTDATSTVGFIGDMAYLYAGKWLGSKMDDCFEEYTAEHNDEIKALDLDKKVGRLSNNRRTFLGQLKKWSKGKSASGSGKDLDELCSNLQRLDTLVAYVKVAKKVSFLVPERQKFIENFVSASEMCEEVSKRNSQ